jgi:uncharacterized protein YlbG (UPF0298 family)
MKKILIMLMLMMNVVYIYAQNTSETMLRILRTDVDEEYMTQLFMNGTLLYSLCDTMDDGKCIKKIEISFADTTMFFGAYIQSSSCTQQEYVAETFVCVFVQIDTEFVSIDIDEEEIQTLPKLRDLLTMYLRKSPMPYIGNNTHVY